MKNIICRIVAPLMLVACGQKVSSGNRQPKTDAAPRPDKDGQEPPPANSLQPDSTPDTVFTPDRFIKCNPENFKPFSGTSGTEVDNQKFAFNFVPARQEEGPVFISVWGWNTVCKDGIHKIPQYGIHQTNMFAKKSDEGHVQFFIQKNRAEYRVGTLKNGRPNFCHGIEDCSFNAIHAQSEIRFILKVGDDELLNQNIRLAVEPEFIPVIAETLK